MSLTRRQQLFGGLAVGLVATILVFAAGEVALRVAYRVRTSLVSAIALPYVVWNVYGPSPPWS